MSQAPVPFQPTFSMKELNPHVSLTPHTTPVCLLIQAEITPVDITMTSSEVNFTDLGNVLQSTRGHKETVVTAKSSCIKLGFPFKDKYSSGGLATGSSLMLRMNVCVTEQNRRSTK